MFKWWANWVHLSSLNSATRFRVWWPPIMYAASGLLAVEYSEIRLSKVIILCCELMTGIFWDLLCTEREFRTVRPIQRTHIKKLRREGTIGVVAITSDSECFSLVVCKAQGVSVRVFWRFYRTVIFAIETKKIYIFLFRIKTTYEWHALTSERGKHSKTLGVGSRNVLHAGRVRSKAISGCLANWQPTILLTLKDENNCGKE